MIKDINPQKNFSKTEHNIQKAKSPPLQTIKQSVIKSSGIRSPASLAVSAGLPSDKLSSSIISFARFFSLALKPDSLAAIRRQAFAHGASELHQNESVKQTQVDKTSALDILKNRTALSLAAAAAECKGAELNPKGLELYAQAVDPDWQRRQDSERRNNRRHNENQSEQREENALSKTGSISASSLKEMAFESIENNSPLCILNRLPGKNGKRWIVIPLTFSKGNLRFNVSLRILVDAEKIQNRSCYMALDIVTNNEQPPENNRQVFVMESANEKPVRLSVYHEGELPKKAQAFLKSELSSLLGMPPQHIFINGRNFSETDELFPFEAGSGEDHFPSIDEAV